MFDVSVITMDVADQGVHEPQLVLDAKHDDGLLGVGIRDGPLLLLFAIIVEVIVGVLAPGSAEALVEGDAADHRLDHADRLDNTLALKYIH